MSEVIQADRDAAAVLFDRVSRASWNSETDPHSEAAQHILRGDGDGSPFVQAFAAHRLAHLPNTDLSDERAREVLASALEENEQMASAEAARNGAIGSWFVPSFVVIRAMHQYAAGLRDALEQIATATDDTDASILRYVARTALGDTQ